MKKSKQFSSIENLYKKISETDAQIGIRREALTKAQSSINNNPYYSEATRVGNLAKLEQQAQTDIGNFIKQKETYLIELRERKVDAQNSPKLEPYIPEDKKNDTSNTTQIVYKITFTIAREILLNGVQIAKPDFESENDIVFDYLYKHPNRKIELAEIEKEIGQGMTKTLHKTVENLGFSGDLKTAFFQVSKTSIYFRNPVTKTDLGELNIRTIKFP